MARLAGTVALALALGAAAPFATAAPQDAHRVSLRYLDGQVLVLNLTPVRSALPPSDDLPPAAGSVSGFWYELRSSAGDVRYRRILGDPIRLYFEGPSAGTPTTLDRDELIPQSRLFTLLIPEATTGDELVLYGSPLVVGFEEQPASMLARIRLVVPEEGTP